MRRLSIANANTWQQILYSGRNSVTVGRDVSFTSKVRGFRWGGTYNWLVSLEYLYAYIERHLALFSLLMFPCWWFHLPRPEDNHR